MGAVPQRDRYIDRVVLPLLVITAIQLLSKGEVHELEVEEVALEDAGEVKVSTLPAIIVA